MLLRDVRKGFCRGSSVGCGVRELFHSARVCLRIARGHALACNKFGRGKVCFGHDRQAVRRVQAVLAVQAQHLEAVEAVHAQNEHSRAVERQTDVLCKFPVTTRMWKIIIQVVLPLGLVNKIVTFSTQ